MDEALLWAQPPEGEHAPDEEHDEKEGELDESFAMRRLRRWLSGMFGESPPEPDDR